MHARANALLRRVEMESSGPALKHAMTGTL